MRKKYNLIYSILLILSDGLAILASFVLAYILRVQHDSRALIAQISGAEYLKIYLILLPFWLITFAFIGLYRCEVFRQFWSELSRVIFGAAIGIMSLITLDFIITKPLFPARLIPVYALVFSIATISIFRLALRLGRYFLARSGKGLTRVLLLGRGDVLDNLYQNLSSGKRNEYRLEGYWSPGYQPMGFSTHKFKSLASALEHVNQDHVDLIVQTEVLTEADNQAIFKCAESNHVEYRLIPTNSSLYGAKMTSEIFYGVPSLTIHNTTLTGWSVALKRLIDIVLSFIAIILASPLFILIAILIKITDPKGKIFYKHMRSGQFGKSFNALKFRSMYQKYSADLKSGKTNIDIFKEMGREDLIEEELKNHKVENDPRITPLGKFLRKTSLDELPQLFNIFFGDISIVGPRPVTKEELKKYGGADKLFLSAKPGLTGLWQVSGRNNVSYARRIQLDIYYIQNWSIWLDFKIILKTIGEVLRGGGK